MRKNCNFFSEPSIGETYHLDYLGFDLTILIWNALYRFKVVLGLFYRCQKQLKYIIACPTQKLQRNSMIWWNNVIIYSYTISFIYNLRLHIKIEKAFKLRQIRIQTLGIQRSPKVYIDKKLILHE